MALYTEKLIMTTFQEMLEELPFDKITVSALVRRAGVSPNTFYYHYQDIYALLDAWFRAELGRFLPDEEGHIDWRTATKTMLRSCRERAGIIYHVFDGLSRDRLERYIFSLTDDVFFRSIQQSAADRGLPEERLQELAAFCRYAYIGFVLQFFWNRMESDIDRSVDRLGVLFERFVAGSLQALETSDA